MKMSHSFCCVLLSAIACWLAAASSTAHAQVTSPLDFFPHEIGNTWEYTDGRTHRVLKTITLTGDTVNAAGDTLIVYNVKYAQSTSSSRGWFRIDSLYRVFSMSHPDSTSQVLSYKLDAQVGDTWRVKATDTIDWAEVLDISSSLVFGTPATKMSVEFSFRAENVKQWYAVETLASGFGLVAVEAHPSTTEYLTGAVVNGKRYGSLVAGDVSTHPTAFSLDAIPDPFTSTATVVYSLLSSAVIRIVISDMLGREVRQLVNRHQEAGEYRVLLDGAELPAGIYLLSLTHNGTRTCRTVRLQR